MAPRAPKLDPRVDAYIAKSADFARPILEHLRKLVHQACPEVEETMKWSAPHFDHHGIMCGMAAFKEHCTFGFWKGKLIVPQESDHRREKEAMGQFGCLRSLADLPADKVIVGYVEKAAKLNESGVKLPRPPKHPKKPIPIPDELAAAFRQRKNARARATFEAFSPSHRREYLEWITTAKGADTRARRLATTVEWLNEGKPHNWKYMAAKAVKAAATPRKAAERAAAKKIAAKKAPERKAAAKKR